MFCWSVGFQRKECFQQKTHHDSTELEVKTATWPLWAPHASESTGALLYWLGGLILTAKGKLVRLNPFAVHLKLSQHC